MVLDDPRLQEQLQDKKKDLQRALAVRESAAEELQLAQKQGQTSVRLREIDVRLAELDLKKYDGQDAEEKELLQLKVELARLLLEQARAGARTRTMQTQATLLSKTALVEGEKTRLAEIEQQITNCRVIAPVDGFVVYYIHPRDSLVVANSPLLDRGEPVREGQKLFQIPDLTKMLVHIQVPETLVTYLRNPDPGKKIGPQLAQIKVDAFPNRLLKGHVQFVDTVPSSRDFFKNDMKTYKTLIAIDEPFDRLKPKMSAEVQIQTDGKIGGVQVPIQSVVDAGKAQYCYVKVGQTIEKRPVITGLRNDRVVEIRKGLKENEAVLLNPQGLLHRLKEFLTPPQSGQKTAQAPDRPLQVCSVSRRIRSKENHG